MSTRGQAQRGVALILAVLATLLTALVIPPAPAAAHEERPITFPDGSGSVPVYRTDGPYLTVCKDDAADFAARIAGFPADVKARNETLYEECQTSGHRDVQAAVDAVQTAGMRILVLPGLYEELPSRPEPTGACANLQAPISGLGHQILSFEQQAQCPHNQNLVAVMGKRDLQIEGTGASPADVVLDAGYSKLNALRGDMANGIYLRNFTAQKTTFNAVYILATDGFAIDDVVGRWNDEYGFLTFGSDHGLYNDCEAYGNGDSGVYPGSASDINSGSGHEVGRYAIEIRGCKSHHNMLGYSGTAGDSVWTHDNEFYENSAGFSTDSGFPDHPGLPQNHALVENNDIHDNNQNYTGYVTDGTCAKPYAERGYEQGVVCPAVSVPVGTGVLVGGGNVNLFRNNHVYGHDSAAFMLLWVPAFVRNETALGKQADTSHDNWYKDNVLGVSPTGESRPNARDFWWDGQGSGNCWQDSSSGSDPIPLPACGSWLSTNRAVGDPTKMLKLLHCAEFDQRAKNVPASCDWYGAAGSDRIEFHLSAAKSVAVIAAVLLGWLVLGLRSYRGTARVFGVPLRPAATVSTVGVIVGTVVATSGHYLDVPLYAPIALTLLGLGWIGLGAAWRRSGRGGLGALSWILGVLSLADAVDKSLLMWPWIPVPPAWLALIAFAVWGIWIVLASARALTRRKPPEPEPDPAGDPERVPAGV
ncbi:right-handed parallel beta-helix repeat-containing protein [Phytomonospora sp. NPDC050363]|uniref:right-handed parallel beta-helix repeat-containing protein n=1 Tax=Phytomonospora sp. NPDC050363 TaxID=3155642 RepID=UPI0033F47C78